mmetsp:Transcript_7833/g.12138  ORF Transcript_7833/g.12138 Transcript_7833/m.12138 type:complete len:96 (-) Transcript_7833:28-315(-)
MAGTTGFKGSTGGFSTMNDTKMFSAHMDKDEEEKEAKRRIGPFFFDIDDEIDTEILTNDQVYDDLKEIEDIFEQGNDAGANSNAGASISKPKKKH